jgi:excisionase family DNA binding protein
MISPSERGRNPNLNPLFRMGTILENEIQYDQVQEFVKTIVNSGKRRGMDETTSLSIIKNYFADLSDAIFNACSEFYNKDVVSESPTPYESEKLLEVSHVADILKVTPQYIHKLIKTGKIPAKNFGERMTRIKESDLNEYLKKKG